MNPEKVPHISVIINCFNGAKYLREAIDSVFAQSYQDWEIIFYDNASTDQSAEIALSYDGKIKYFRAENHISLGAARNSAICQATGEFITFLDADDKWLPEKLEAQVALMEKNPDAVLGYSNVYILDEFLKRTYLAYRCCLPSGQVFSSFMRYYPVNLQTVILRKECLNTLSEIFDNKLSVSEEFDLFMRLLYNKKAVYLDQPTAIYRLHPNMTSISKNNLYAVENEYILNKLILLFPKFNQEYPAEIRYLRAKIAYWYALGYMERGQRLLARQQLRPHKKVALEFFILFISTHFPVSIWSFLMKWKSTYRRYLSNLQY